MSSNMTRRFLVAAALIIALSAPAFPQQRRVPKDSGEPLVLKRSGRADSPPPVVTPEQRRRQEAFDKSWQILNENYFDKTFGGLDWQKVRGEYQPRVAAARTDGDVHRLIQEMIARIGTSHFALIPPEYFAAIEAAKKAVKARETSTGQDATGTDSTTEYPAADPFNLASTRYGIGVDLRFIEDKIVVTRVDDLSGAAQAGIRPGYIVDKVNGISLDAIVAEVLRNNPSVRNIRRFLPQQIVAWFLNGEADTTVRLTCINEKDEEVVYTVSRLPLTGTSISIGNNYPEQFLQFQSRSLSDDIGYIRFNVFAIPVIGKFCDALTELSDKKAIILDLRGNTGGIIATIIGLTGMLTEQPLIMGTSVYRVGSEILAVAPKNKSFKGKLILLVDNQSVSAAELFSAGMKDNGRATIVGERTAGEALPAVAVRLATGAVMIYPIANFKTTHGTTLEGNGLQPDYTVLTDRRSLLQGIDRPLEKAMSLITEQIAQSHAVPVGPKIAAVGDRTGRLEAPASAPPPPPKVHAPRPDVQPKTATGKDARAIKAISDFISAIGGETALRGIRTYEARGTAVIAVRGAETEVELRAVRQVPDKFLFALSSPAMGEVREIYNGKRAMLQTDYGLENDSIATIDTNRAELFSAMFTLLDPTFFNDLKFEGPYDIDGIKKVYVWGTTSGGYPVGLSFDTQTKLLHTYSLPSAMYTFEDYRRVGGAMMPFRILLQNGMKMQLSTVQLNPAVEPALFEKREMCFDRAK